jgi:hypothetical protein
LPTLSTQDVAEDAVLAAITITITSPTRPTMPSTGRRWPSSGPLVALDRLVASDRAEDDGEDRPDSEAADQAQYQRRDREAVARRVVEALRVG